MNTHICECEFPDGTIKEYDANIIAENIFNKCDPDGHCDRMMLKLIYHKRSGNVLRHDDGFITTKLGQKRMRQTTVGWKLLVEWDDESKQWVELKILKESNPAQIAEYVIA